MLEWVAFSFSRGSSRPRDRIFSSCISCIGGWIIYQWATWKTPFIIMTLKNKKLGSMGAIHDVQVSGDNQWGDFKSPESSLRAQELENQLGWEPTENAQKFGPLCTWTLTCVWKNLLLFWQWHMSFWSLVLSLRGELVSHLKRRTNETDPILF